MSWLYTQFPSLKSAYDRLTLLSARERGLLMCLLVVVAGIVLVYLILLPSLEYKETHVRSLGSAQTALEWMKQNQGQARRLAGTEVSPRRENNLSAISRSAKMSGLEIRRLQPRENAIDIELSEQDSNAVLVWLASLEREFGFQIATVRIDTVSEGVVNSRVMLRY